MGPVEVVVSSDLSSELLVMKPGVVSHLELSKDAAKPSPTRPLPYICQSRCEVPPPQHRSPFRSNKLHPSQVIDTCQRIDDYLQSSGLVESGMVAKGT